MHSIGEKSKWKKSGYTLPIFSASNYGYHTVMLNTN